LVAGICGMNIGISPRVGGLVSGGYSMSMALLGAGAWFAINWFLRRQSRIKHKRDPDHASRSRLLLHQTAEGIRRGLPSIASIVRRNTIRWRQSRVIDRHHAGAKTLCHDRALPEDSPAARATADLREAGHHGNTCTEGTEYPRVRLLDAPRSRAASMAATRRPRGRLPVWSCFTS
jgi:hypothetical protein